MTARQWVAHAGLDPCMFESGSSVHRAPRISKRGNATLRAALYLPATNAKKHDRYIKAYAAHLKQRGKRPKQINVAIMRKLLHAIHAMFRTDTPFDSSRFSAVPIEPVEPIERMTSIEHPQPISSTPPIAAAAVGSGKRGRRTGRRFPLFHSRFSLDRRGSI
jgi:hypothetical protein